MLVEFCFYLENIPASELNFMVETKLGNCVCSRICAVDVQSCPLPSLFFSLKTSSLVII